MAIIEIDIDGYKEEIGEEDDGPEIRRPEERVPEVGPDLQRVEDDPMSEKNIRKRKKEQIPPIPFDPEICERIRKEQIERIWRKPHGEA